MRNFFIDTFDKLIGVIAVLMSIGVVLFALGVSVAGFGPEAPSPAGPLGGLAILIGGGLYVAFLIGALYTFVGIYRNSERTVELLERLAAK